MSKQITSGHENSSWVSNILTSTGIERISSTWAENGVVTAIGSTRVNASTADKAGTEVFDNVSVKIGGYHDIELVRVGNQLHAGVVNNHVFVLNSAFVFFGNSVASSHEETVSFFHDVGFVDAGDLGSAVFEGIIKSESSDSFSFSQSRDFQTLDDTWNRLVFFAAVFSFGTLSNDNEVNVLHPGFNAVVRVDMSDMSESIQISVHLHLHAQFVVDSASAGQNVTFKADFVFFDASHGTVDIFSVRVWSEDFGDLLFVEDDWRVDGGEDFFGGGHNFWTDSIAWDQSDFSRSRSADYLSEHDGKKKVFVYL